MCHLHTFEDLLCLVKRSLEFIAESQHLLAIIVREIGCKTTKAESFELVMLWQAIKIK